MIQKHMIIPMMIHKHTSAHYKIFIDLNRKVE
jgi:hypothetical protein